MTSPGMDFAIQIPEVNKLNEMLIVLAGVCIRQPKILTKKLRHLPIRGQEFFLKLFVVVFDELLELGAASARKLSERVDTDLALFLAKLSPNDVCHVVNANSEFTAH